jgi:hypothetical protein
VFIDYIRVSGIGDHVSEDVGVKTREPAELCRLRRSAQRIEPFAGQDALVPPSARDNEG